MMTGNGFVFFRDSINTFSWFIQLNRSRYGKVQLLKYMEITDAKNIQIFHEELDLV